MLVQNAFRYLIISLLTFFNFIGLFVVDKLPEESKKVEMPPSTLVVQKTFHLRTEIDYDLEHKKVHSEYITYYGIIFRHGDISWLPTLAAQAGWPQHTWAKLGQIILRESGGCPNRLGGDVVNQNCIIKRVSEWNHRSDTGLLQINGVNYNINRNKWAVVCNQMNICTQDPLLDPLTNLKAGKLLYDVAGWSPWNPCAWDPSRCSKVKFVSD
jgi:hypothetical protein